MQKKQKRNTRQKNDGRYKESLNLGLFNLIHL